MLTNIDEGLRGRNG